MRAVPVRQSEVWGKLLLPSVVHVGSDIFHRSVPHRSPHVCRTSTDSLIDFDALLSSAAAELNILSRDTHMALSHSYTSLFCGHRITRVRRRHLPHLEARYSSPTLLKSMAFVSRRHYWYLLVPLLDGYENYSGQSRVPMNLRRRNWQVYAVTATHRSEVLCIKALFGCPVSIWDIAQSGSQFQYGLQAGVVFGKLGVLKLKLEDQFVSATTSKINPCIV